MEQEIRTRLAIASSAFAELSRPVLCNKHIPPKRRAQLLQALICSKLYFGLGAWNTPSVRQLQKLKGALQRMLKRVLHVPADEGIPIHMIHKFALIGILEPRAKLAVDRLLYAQRLWAHGPTFLQHQLLREDMVDEGSWIAGLKADLCWLWQLVDPPDPQWRESPDDLTGLIDFWQSDDPRWRKMIKQAWRRYSLQEAMVHEAANYHKMIFELLKQHGADFEGDVTGNLRIDETMLRFECDKCHRCFSSALLAFLPIDDKAMASVLWSMTFFKEMYVRFA